MKNVMVSSLFFVTMLCNAQVPFNDSIYNFQNSPYNFENSQYNFKNSPSNFDNNQYNFNSPNATYNAQGQRDGYKTETNQGVTNYFDNNGNRKGYSTK